MAVLPAETIVAASPKDALQKNSAMPRRRDIQGLRALAVLLVLIYHLKPDLLPGGFIGVDVFFVISGFLIIGLLANEIQRTGQLRLFDFYARRIRRLLPAASAVLLATITATLFFLPMSRWPVILHEVVASALNVQNWTLAVFSTNYAEATVVASPVQHFWSLSVEEQFYLIIPLILLGSVWIAKRRGGNLLRTLFVSVSVVTLTSLAFSVVFTPGAHNAAYFITPTRIWELGLGGLLALGFSRLRPNRISRLLLGWGGLGAIVASAVWLSTDFAFPGWIALIPTLGTVGLLAAGALSATEKNAEKNTAVETVTLLGRQPLRYIGDISYSLYLWHWPVIVLILGANGQARLSLLQMTLAIVVSFALAAASKHFIEDPFRFRSGVVALTIRKRLRWPRGTYLVAAVLVALPVALAIVPGQIVQKRLDVLASSFVLGVDHPGATAVDPNNPADVPTGVRLVPDPAVAGRDLPFKTMPDCATYEVKEHSVASSTCSFGVSDAPKKLVLLGDSHAGQFSSALGEFVRGDPSWQVKTLVRNGCPFADASPSERGIAFTGCADLNRVELAEIEKMKPDLVVTSAMFPEFYQDSLKWTWESRQQLVEGYRRMLSTLAEAGIPVVVIHDVPRPNTIAPTCLERNRENPKACDTPRAVAFPSNQDPLVEASRLVVGTKVIDLTDWICTTETCPAVVGNVVVYRDNHLTDSYARTLREPLVSQLGLR